MLVYGDHAWEEEPREKLARIEQALGRIWGMPGGVERHAALVASFIELGELTQGLADAAFAERKADARSVPTNTSMRLLIALAGAVERSWNSGFRDLASCPLALVRQLPELAWPDTVRISLPEGYAFYALYPEAYIGAAKALAGRRLNIIGLRSIGTGLAAAVAAGAGESDAVTVRPVGHPFQRKLALADSLRDEMLSDPTADFAIVDEGPGLSGSSFGCVADFLEANGVEPRRIHFFPGHAGDLGPEAAPRHRMRWAKAQRHVMSFERLVLDAAAPCHRVERWVEEIVGKPPGPPSDISGGAWRKHRYRNKADWPPANPQQERRKLIFRAGGGSWLARFAGLGRYGEDKLAIGRMLAEAGFTPPVAGFRHGFLIEQWFENAQPLRPRAVDRERLVEHLGRYVGFRARHLLAPRPGASLEELLTMASRNAELALGEETARGLDRWKSILPRLARHACPIRTDNRLHAWEWLVVGDRLIKADALDHQAAHDLVGCQDLAWDIAGATAELALSPGERDRLCATAEREAGRPLVPELIEFLTIGYLAFQLGAFTLAAQANTHDPAEATRLRGAAGAYADSLRLRLMGEPAPQRTAAARSTALCFATEQHQGRRS
jgi:hypothetical protein